MYAKLHRIAICVALGVIALGCVPLVHAGYAFPSDPVGFVRSGTWGVGYGYAASANDSTFGKIIHQKNGLTVPVPGKAVTMPVSYRLAQNAPRIAAGVIFAHPAVRTASGIAAWLGVGKLIWDESGKIWRETGEKQPVGDLVWPYNGVIYYSPGDACDAAYAREVYDKGRNANAGIQMVGTQAVNCLMRDISIQNSQPSIFAYVYAEKRPGSMQCPAGWEDTGAGCLSPAVPQPQFEEILAPKTMPQTVPKELPYPSPLPVEPQPYINPEPGSTPQTRPMFVPTGDPVPNPNYDPNAAPGPDNQPWIQPGVRLNPSPTASEPWRIDGQPVDRPKDTKEPMQGPESENNPNDKPTESKEQIDLCEKNPDILACSKPELDTPDDEIPKTNRDVSLQPENLFGGGSCPANKVMTVGGQQVTVWDWDQSCGYITGYMRPVVLVLCAFAAFMIVSGGARQ